MGTKPTQTVYACMFNYNCPSHSSNVLDDVVILEHSYDDVHTASAAPKVEDGLKRLSPSSPEISFPAELCNMRKLHANQHETAPQTMLKRTTKPAKTEPQTPYRNKIRNRNTSRKPELSRWKIFFCTHTSPLPQRTLKSNKKLPQIVMLLTPFDPWHSPLCTCLNKLTFNPYTGCDHNCIYCYATSYIPNFNNCKPKKNLIPRLQKEARHLKGQLVSISNSSDPYPTIEKELELTRKCLQTLSNHNCRIQIITKSNLVTRDIDVLQKAKSIIAFTITTDIDTIAKRLEPIAPPPSHRIQAIETLTQKGIPVCARIDPIIPYLNDNCETLIKKLADIGVKHVTSSTYKVKQDNWKRFTHAFPTTAKKLAPLYFEKGKRISGYRYLPQKLRYNLMKHIRDQAEQAGMTFGTCREDLAQLNTASCAGAEYCQH